MIKKNYIVINGRKYDSSTGELVQEQPKKPETTHSAKNIGEIIRPNLESKHQSNQQPKPKVRPNTPVRATNHHSKNHQKSQTLMRQAVKKPAPNLRKSVQQDFKTISKSQLSVHPERIKQAIDIQRSPQIKKYQQPSIQQTKIAALPVRKPAQPIDSMQTARPKPVQQPTIPQNPQQTQTANPASQLVDRTIQNANSHQQKFLPEQATKRKRRLSINNRVLQFAMGSLAVLLLAGFFAIQNIPHLSMRIAASRSGVASSMPGYTPSGFAFRGPINYSDGIVKISFRSNSDDRSYTVSQQNSSWNSESLLNEFVASKAVQYQTYTDGRGRTLYIYDKHNATWVQNGIWYVVEGDSDLSTDQLASLAASL